MSQLQVDTASIFFSLLGHLSNSMKLASRTSKTKAMREALWRSLKPKAFSTPKKSAPAPDPTTRPKKKRKVTSSRGSLSPATGLVPHAHTDMPSKAAQLSVAHDEDVPEDRPRHSAWSHQLDEGGHPELPPHVARRKRPGVRDNMDGQSDMSQSDGGKTSDSQDYESDQDDEDLQKLNGDELARTLDNEVRLFILMQCEITQLFSGCPMDTETFTVIPTHSPQQQRR